MDGASGGGYGRRFSDNDDQAAAPTGAARRKPPPPPSSRVAAAQRPPHVDSEQEAPANNDMDYERQTVMRSIKRTSPTGMAISAKADEDTGYSGDTLPSPDETLPPGPATHSPYEVVHVVGFAQLEPGLVHMMPMLNGMTIRECLGRIRNTARLSFIPSRTTHSPDLDTKSRHGKLSRALMELLEQEVDYPLVVPRDYRVFIQ